MSEVHVHLYKSAEGKENRAQEAMTLISLLEKSAHATLCESERSSERARERASDSVEEVVRQSERVSTVEK
jgi:hypothetical protein